MDKGSTSMSEGCIWKKITFFALPLFLGNLFQQLYNTADSLIVGNFLGSNALAAVSSSGNLIFLMVGFFNGIAMGAGVVIARYFGAKDVENMQKAIHTTVAFGLVASVVLTFVGVLLAPQMLIWMDTPSNVLPSSITYFRIYFAGSLGLVMYNIFVGILQTSAILFNYFFDYQFCLGYCIHFFFSFWCWCSGFCDHPISVFKCLSLPGVIDAKQRILSFRTKKDYLS